jgi:hypothetical protein
MLFRHLAPFALIILLASCGQQGETSATDVDGAGDSLSGWYGEEFVIADVMPASGLTDLKFEGTSSDLVIEAKILECCRKKGCWMKVDLGDGRSMRVSFKDYGFFVPLNADGRMATLKGVAYMDTIDVELLRHFAEDAGRSAEEIAAITEPELELSFEATGVLIK